jgi:MFS-type transporter involved in bile tolerance (Atg22 family)
MAEDAETLPDPVQYVNEDTRPTSKRELAGWYSYGWAAEVFTVCAMGMDTPLSSTFLFSIAGTLSVWLTSGPLLRVLPSHHARANGS